MKGKILFQGFLLLFVMVFFSSCSFFKGVLDERSRFSAYLTETEIHIRQERWENAFQSMEKARKAWKQIKPFLQLDIDHDYVNLIQEQFSLLKGNIETRQKPNSLAIILLLEDTWKNIGEL